MEKPSNALRDLSCADLGSVVDPLCLQGESSNVMFGLSAAGVVFLDSRFVAVVRNLLVEMLWSLSPQFWEATQTCEFHPGGRVAAWLRTGARGMRRPMPRGALVPRSPGEGC